MAINRTQNLLDVSKEDQKYVFFEASGGISTMTEASKIINCYNFLNTTHGWIRAGGIVAKATGALIHCNNYGNFDMLTMELKSSAYPHRYFQIFELSLSGLGGIVGYIGPLRNNDLPKHLEKLIVPQNYVSECNNYGNIAFRPLKGGKVTEEYVNQIVGYCQSRVENMYCNEYGKIIRK